MAVNAAEKAYTTWSKLTPHARARHLYRQESSTFKAFGIFVYNWVGTFNHELLVSFTVLPATYRST